MTKILPCIYRSQRDNVLRPGSSCNVTAAVMVLEASGHPPSEIASLPAGAQPEDLLTQIAESKASYDHMRLTCPQFYDMAGNPAVHPAEAPFMLDWIVAQAYGRYLLRYSENITFGKMQDQIDAGRAVLLHGLLTPEGHYVAMVGYDALDDVGGKIGAVTALRLDDSWGDWQTGYTSRNGEHTTLPLNRATELLRPMGSVIKSGHFVIA